MAMIYGLNVISLGDQCDMSQMRKTYDAAPVPDPEMSPPRMARSVESLDGMTMPIQRADPTKKTRIRQTKDR